MFPQLATKRLILREIEGTDINKVYQALSDERVIRYYGVSYKSLRDTRKQMQWFRELRDNNTGIWWAIASKESSTFLGACGFNDYTSLHHKASLGYWLLPEYWGQGYGYEAVNAIVEYVFSATALHRIDAEVEEGNQKSAALLKNLGFKLETVFRECELKNGGYINIIIYGLLRKEWLGRGLR